MGRKRARRGVALLTTLALLALASALLAGGFASATASARAARSARASHVATAMARRALGRALLEWSAVEERLTVGAAVERVVAESSPAAIDAANARVRVQRISADLYVIAADVRVPAVGVMLARRRMRVIVQRSASVDSTQILAPRAIARWAIGELY
jgi:hypothetical protein